MTYTLGSLFDGSGGFPLAASLCGITPIWAAEVEPYPIAVTRSRFPDMKHLGDVQKVRGGDITPVDIITFGSPCQDLSVAGKRAGLKHEANGDDETTRSGLFLEAIRIIKEMRSATNGVYPRFAIWENVFGAFSSNRGEDFRTVLEEFCKIVEPSASVPAPGKNGWPYADCYMGAGWSIAYRTFDAQYWGVPQRRRRIYLVADFGGECAWEILFEREGVRGYFETGRTPWKGAAGGFTTCVGAASFDGYNGSLTYDTSATLGVNCGMSTDRNGIVLNDHGGNRIDITDFEPCGWNGGQISPTLTKQNAGGNQRMPDKDNFTCVLQPFGICSKDSNAMKSANPNSGFYEADTTRTLDANGGNPSCNQGGIAVVSIEGNGSRPSHRGDGYSEGDAMYTINSVEQHAVAYSMTTGSFPNVAEEKTPHLTARDYKDATVVTEPSYGIGRDAFNQGANAQYKPCIEQEVQPTIVAKGHGAVAHSYGFYPQMKAEGITFTEDKSVTLVNGTNPGFQNGVLVPSYTVRRLTPTECARLQGFPDKWGHPDHKEDFTDEEYSFWLNVRNTYAAINRKAVRQYTRQQMLSWYNKLHTDSAEYKMWGNGIALPNALYVIQGIRDTMEG